MATKRKQAADSAPEADNIDKVRDILFGAQSRDIERRFQEMEDRMARDNDALRDEVRRRLSSVEEFVNAEFDALRKKLRGEESARESADTTLKNELEAHANASEAKLKQAVDELEDTQRKLRQRLLEMSTELQDDVQRRATQIGERLDAESRRLTHDKTDRRALASLFTEVAARLNADNGDADE